jgi:hypothetical protein
MDKKAGATQIFVNDLPESRWHGEMNLNNPYPICWCLMPLYSNFYPHLWSQNIFRQNKINGILKISGGYFSVSTRPDYRTEEKVEYRAEPSDGL